MVVSPMSMKPYQIAIIFFTLGVFGLAVALSFFAISENANPIATPTPDLKYSEIKIFFSNTSQDPNSLNCEITYPASREISMLSENESGRLGELAYIAIRELLKGPTESEKSMGFFTLINPEAKIQKISIENGIAKADFNQAFNEGVGGSCRVQAIRSQITETLKQFPQIKEVIISVNGDSENTLQP